MALDLKSGFLVGDCEVKPMLGQVVGQNGPVHVEPEVMDVLPYRIAVGPVPPLWVLSS